MTSYYDLTLIASLALALIYVCAWHKHFDVRITLVFVFVPIINLGYCLLNRAQSQEAALVANVLTYISGCYLLPIIMFTVFSLCHIKLPRWISVGLLTINTIVLLCLVFNGESGLIYRSVSFRHVDDQVIFTKVYGPVHTIYYATIFACFLASIGAMVYSYIRKKQVSRKLIYLLFFPVTLSMLSFFAGRRLVKGIELVPFSFTVALLIYLIIVHRICLYDITDTAIDTLVQTGDTAFISIDFKLNYLGSNATAKSILPELNELTVDKPLAKVPAMDGTVLAWLKAFIRDESDNTALFERNNRIYKIQSGYLYDSHRKRGYQLFITDDTADRQYINLLANFNTELQREVDEKTAHILAMHNNLILSMATMVESRDNSTGGHIRRTSEGVRLLTAEIQADSAFAVSDAFCQNLIKAAPMHDLGKIAVDDAILRKPGRFTPEEFEKMKTHAAEGARIVHEVLKDTDDPDFRIIAENVAHYHHERWDGSGYPEGLKGDEIPIEARIMAIADVYDALVSKRVYKESMPFDKADAIIMEGMGKHFDARLEPCYLRARPKLEAYYAAMNAAES